MKITVIFGFKGPEHTVNWWNQIEQFPKLFKYNGKRWEWFMYDKDSTGKSDYILNYSELPQYDPNFYVEMDSFEDKYLNLNGGEGCTCGARYSSFEWDHLKYCAKYKNW